MRGIGSGPAQSPRAVSGNNRDFKFLGFKVSKNTLFEYLAEPETRRREAKQVALGRELWPDADGRLLFHEYTPGIAETEISGAQPAWRFLTEPLENPRE